MTRVMVRYRIKPEEIEHNVELVEAVYAELERERPEGFRYMTMQGPDGEFVHTAFYERDGIAPLPGLDAFKRFTENIGDRCVEQPATTEYELVGSYEF